MNVSLVLAPPALQARAVALATEARDDRAAGEGLAGLLPDGLVAAAGWPQPDDLIGFLVSTTNRLVVVDGAVVGGMGPKGDPVGGVREIGYGVVPGARGTGVSDRALALLVAELFAEGATIVAAEVLEANTPSWHLLERQGFRRADTAERGGHRRYELARS